MIPHIFAKREQSSVPINRDSASGLETDRISGKYTKSVVSVPEVGNSSRM